MTLVIGSHKRPHTATVSWKGPPPPGGVFLVDRGEGGGSFFIKPTPPQKEQPSGAKWLSHRSRHSIQQSTLSDTNYIPLNKESGSCCLCSFVQSELDSFDMRRKKKVALSIAKDGGGLTHVVSMRKNPPAVIKSLFTNEIRARSTLIARLRNVDNDRMRKIFRSLMRSNGSITKPDFISLIRVFIPGHQVWYFSYFTKEVFFFFFFSIKRNNKPTRYA